MASTLNAALSASASALNAERTRIEVAVSNLANAESTRGPDGQPYRRKDVVLASQPTEQFQDLLSRANATGVRVAAGTPLGMLPSAERMRSMAMCVVSLCRDPAHAGRDRESG